jgi:DNA end-binding protein Ku
MARSIWSGSLAFGLVNVPVGLYSATHDLTVRFHQFERGTSSRIRYRRVNEDTGEEVDYGDIVKGHDVGGGEYVIVTPEELEEVEPGRSRTIEITDFVDADDIDPIHYQKTYYLAPADDAAARAYALLRTAMLETGRTAIATFVMRSKQYLAAVRATGEVLTLETMFFGEEVRDPIEEIDDLPADAEVSSRDLDTAITLIDALTTPWDPSNYTDTYRARVLELIDAKRRGEDVVVSRDREPSAEVVDLMSVLQRSVDDARGRRPGNAHQRRSIRAGRGREPDDAAAMTKAELYDVAQQLDVPGRSSMSKDELLDAVTAAREERAS